MSQQTFSPGATQLAEPPAPLLPEGDSVSAGDNSRRKLMIVGAVAGVLVLAIVAFFLMKGGSSNTASGGFLVPHHAPAASAPAAKTPPVVKLPKHVVAPVGRDPFKALYTAPVAASTGPTATTGGATSPSTSTTGSTPTTTTSGGSTTPTATTTPTYHPVWVQLKSVTASTATFDVGLSNGKTLKAVRYSGVKPLHSFRNFELLSIHTGVVTVKYGDGTPFQLDKTHNTMVVD
jgi:hypothetical protein